MCWEVDGTETDTPSDSSPPTTSSTKAYFAPNVGLVEVKNITNGQTTELSKYSVISTHLAVTTPSTTLAGDPFNPVLQVTIIDSTGATDTNPADAVTITPSIGAGSTGTGTLSSAAGVTTVGGVATFSGLSIDKPGTYVITFSDSVGRSIPTDPFKVAAGKLIFKPDKLIKNAVSGSSLEPAIEVELVDSKGKLITDAPSMVTLAPSGPGAGNPITGNTAQQAGGIAMFPGVKLTKPGDYTLDATDDQGDVTATSNQFEITGLHMAFKKNIGKTGANSRLGYLIELEDSKDRLVNNSHLGLILTLNTIDGGTGAALSTAADIFSFGKADNSTSPLVSINAAGTYTITFTVRSESDPSINFPIDPITSDQFQVVGNQLVFVHVNNSLPNVPLKYKVEMQDYKRHLVTTAADGLTFTLNPIGGATGVLAGGSDSLIGGIAVNQSASPLSIDSPGEYTLTVNDVPGAGEPGALSGMSHMFKVVTGKPKSR